MATHALPVTLAFDPVAAAMLSLFLAIVGGAVFGLVWLIRKENQRKRRLVDTLEHSGYQDALEDDADHVGQLLAETVDSGQATFQPTMIYRKQATGADGAPLRWWFVDAQSHIQRHANSRETGRSIQAVVFELDGDLLPPFQLRRNFALVRFAMQLGGQPPKLEFPDHPAFNQQWWLGAHEADATVVRELFDDTLIQRFETLPRNEQAWLVAARGRALVISRFVPFHHGDPAANLTQAERLFDAFRLADPITVVREPVAPDRGHAPTDGFGQTR